MDCSPTSHPDPLRAPQRPVRPRVAMVFGSGGLKCVAAFGVMRVLRREKIPVDLVVACSGGALCGTWVASASDEDPDVAARRLTGLSAGNFDRIDYRTILSAVFPRWIPFRANGGIVKDDRLNRSLRQELGESRFEDLTIPLHLVATDAHTGEKVVLSKGSLFDAARATMAIPLVLPPWQVGGRYLADGAICDPLPVDVAIREGADIIIAVGFESPVPGEVASGLGLVRRLTVMSSNHLLRAQFAFQNLAHHSEVLPILPEFDGPVGLKDLHRIGDFVEKGAIATEREIDYLRRLLHPETGLMAAGGTLT